MMFTSTGLQKDFTCFQIAIVPIHEAKTVILFPNSPTPPTAKEMLQMEGRMDRQPIRFNTAPPVLKNFKVSYSERVEIEDETYLHTNKGYDYKPVEITIKAESLNAAHARYSDAMVLGQIINIRIEPITSNDEK